MRWPTFFSAPGIRVLPHVGFSSAIRTTTRRISRRTLRRPGCRAYLFDRHHCRDHGSAVEAANDRPQRCSRRRRITLCSGDQIRGRVASGLPVPLEDVRGRLLLAAVATHIPYDANDRHPFVGDAAPVATLNPCHNACGMQPIRD